MTRSVQIDQRQRSEGRKKFFHMMFTTALEGGIGYWSECDQYHWSKSVQPWESKVPGGVMEDDLDNFHATIYNNEDDWGVEAAYQPNTVGADIHPNFTPDSHMIHIVKDDQLSIDIDVIERGWELFMDAVIEATKSEDPGMSCSRKYFRQAIIQYLTDGQEGDSDADVADIVVQMGLFGEIVYA